MRDFLQDIAALISVSLFVTSALVWIGQLQ